MTAEIAPFLNFEPETLLTPCPPDLLRQAPRALDYLRIMVEMKDVARVVELSVTVCRRVLDRDGALVVGADVEGPGPEGPAAELARLLEAPEDPLASGVVTGGDRPVWRMLGARTAQRGSITSARAPLVWT
jgi:hypothetical protein